MLDIGDVTLFAVLGLTAGLLSGLFGIGGGMVVVPGLFYLFHRFDIPHDYLMHIAAGSSMGVMVFTSMASVWSHHCRGGVQWPLFRRIIPAIAIGVALGKTVAGHLNTDILEFLFGMFLVAISLEILLDWLPKREGPVVPFWLTHGVGLVLGVKSGILGIGGGAISVPFLLYSGLPMSQASGTSASFTLPIALCGAFSSLLFDAHGLPLTTGTVYWPAVLLVAPFTVIGAPLGARLCHQLPSARLKRWFAIFLLLLGLRLLLEAAQWFIGVS